MSSQFREERPRGRPRSFDEAALIDTVTDLFWRKGFAGTSLSDLTDATGAARASFYKLYGDKEALLARALGTYADRFHARVDATLAKGLSPREAVAETLTASADRLADPDAPNGCLRCRTTLEQPEPRADVAAALDRANGGFVMQMERLLTGDGNPTPRDRQRALALTAAVNGMVVLAEAGADRGALQAVIDATLDAVFPPA
ncbi:TetR/AcrR family transcriptional regulator [Aestuariibius sp. 2305UL40-4]|uniref:TetR/AcrR family transcriptional regulator n=1 Tax=Aestuariibius violaceus TaxID=3234132 RepID=UPI00345E8B95